MTGWSLAVLALVVAFLAGVRSQTIAPPRLVAGASIEQTATPKSTYAYEVALRAGDVLDLTATQDQVIVKFTVTEPAGGTAHAFDLPQIHPLPDRLIFLAQTTGVHRIEVYVDGTNTRATVPRDGPLAFTIGVEQLGPASPADVERARVARLGARAGALVGQQTLSSIEKAIPLFVEAANGWRALGERRLEGATLRGLANTSAFFTQFRIASAEAWERQIAIWRDLGELDLEWDSWRGLNVEYADDGRSVQARDAGREAIRLSRAFPDRLRHGMDLRRAAFDEMVLGNYEEARRLAGQALDVGIAVGDVIIEARALDVLARLQALSGDRAAAMQQQERALQLVGEDRIRRQFLMPLGFYQLQQGDLDAAERTFTEGLALATRFVQREWDALMRIGLGDIKIGRGDRAGARSHYDEARTNLLKTGFLVYRCTLETRAGRLELSDGHLDAGRARFDEALAIATRLGDGPCEAESRSGLADVALATDRLDEAQAQALRVVELVEGFREASVNIEARTLGFASMTSAYERAVDLSMRLAVGSARDAHVAAALSLHERALARGLLDGLTTERLERAVRVPAPLQTELRQLRESWRARVVEHETMVQRNATERAKSLAAEIASLAARLRDVEARIDAIDPRHASFVRPQPLNSEAIRALLDEDTLLLEYALGESRSYLWAVDAREIRAFTLAPRAEIEAAARLAHAALAREPRGLAARSEQQREAVDSLARLVLGPGSTLLAKRRLVVVASGALALVPFSALPVLSAAREASGVEGPVLSRVEGLLIAEHEIVSLPSATVLAALRSLEMRRPRSSKSAVVFADPVYERDDPRLTTGLVPPTTSVTRSAGHVRSDADSEALEPPRGWATALDHQRGVALTRLLFSRREAAAIQRYAPNRPLSLVGLEATRARALSPDLADYGIIHFAAHGLMQAEVPNLSGVALSLVDRQGRPQNGFLMLPDVYDLSLNADLVVLSACQTALGNEIRGEGVVGLPRGFMYAGASRVISSLWRVDDEATAALMDGFYRRLLSDRLPPAAALRAAQLEVRRTPRWRAPFFWAGFVLQGDWR
jgi:CHAT domain-containing protein/tetratricopeptide (TPR) repeat protein